LTDPGGTGQVGVVGLWNLRWPWTRRTAALNDALSQARVALSAPCISDALVCIADALELAPGDAQALELLERALLLEGDRVGLALATRVKTASGDPEVCFELGSHLLQHGRPRVARALLSMAVRGAPFDAEARSELAMACLRSGAPQG